MNRIHLHPAIAILLFGISAFASGLFLVWAWHQTLHVIYDLSQNHQHGFAVPAGIRAFVSVVFVLILRYWARPESLGAWILCNIGFATIFIPVVMSIRIMAGQNINLILYSDAMEVPYGPLLGLLATNLIVGTIHGGLGWLFMQRLMSNRSRAS